MDQLLYDLDYSILSFTNEPIRFLNGLTSNLFDQPCNAFLDIHGKVVATFFQYQLNENHLLAVLSRAVLTPLFSHLAKYLRVSKVMVREEKKLISYFNLGNDHNKEDDFVIPLKSGEIVVTKTRQGKTVTEEKFRWFRLKQRIPLQGVDYQHEMILNIDEDQFVSYNKGCFLGQEIVSRVHHLGNPPKRLSVVCEDELPAAQRNEITSKTTDPETGKRWGFTFLNNKI